MPDSWSRFEEPRNIERTLAKNRRRREAARIELEAAREALRALLVRGRAIGLSVSAMARIAGISRDTAHKLLREARPRKKGRKHG
jgi:DNA-directed RNA polymerase specialized sigma24 family protein